jgi:phosphatidylglycerophosphate synthase
MTLLDTVDGKLARVTVASSKFGHVLDHGVDIVHPPFWYLAWGLGLGAWRPSILCSGRSRGASGSTRRNLGGRRL